MLMSAATITTRWRSSRSNQAAPSGTPGERREMPVVALAEEAEREAEALHLGLFRPGEGEPTIGGMGCIVDIERLARAVARGHALDLEAEHARYVGDAPQAVGGEIDPLVFDAAEILHQVVADHLRRAAGLAAHDLGQRLALPLVRALVDDDAEDPAAVGHDASRADDQGELQAVEGYRAVAAAIDAVDHERVAMLMRRRRLGVGVDAGTEIVAVAAFHVLAAQFPGLLSHRSLRALRESLSNSQPIRS